MQDISSSLLLVGGAAALLYLYWSETRNATAQQNVRLAAAEQRAAAAELRVATEQQIRLAAEQRAAVEQQNRMVAEQRAAHAEQELRCEIERVTIDEFMSFPEYSKSQYLSLCTKYSITPCAQVSHTHH